MLRAFYSDTFVLPLPVDHRFPMAKYYRVRDRILELGILPSEQVITATPATYEQLLRCHDAEYIDKVMQGTLSKFEQRRIGFPWSPELVRRSVRTVGATIQACHAAFAEGVSVNLAGGTHHAYPDHGEGYCVFNDAAVAARAMQDAGLARRVVILDGDVHQGNGTAAIFAQDRSVFTFSIHGAKNFPFHKEKSDLDIELPDRTEDAPYLALLEEGVTRSLAAANADIAIYLAGADPYYKDRLGRMALTMDGLATRDHIVLRLCQEAGIPVAIAMAGGYSPDVEDIVAIHVQTVKIATEYAR